MNNASVVPYKGYRIFFSKRSQKFLRQLPVKQRGVFIDKFDILVGNARQLNIKKLQGCKVLYRIKVGEYRVVFEPDFDKNAIYVHIIAHRKNIYAILPRLKSFDA